MMNQAYKDQVKLLLQIIPYVSQEKIFALKGGTAINMFIWNMPRLSVDLDLTYINFDEREVALVNISAALDRIKAKLLIAMPEVIITTKGTSDYHDEKLICRYRGVQVKIEVNTIMRGIIYPVRSLPISNNTLKMFNLFAEMNIVSNAELFGGKICAALDRQHPRDLFDIYHLIQNNGFTDDVKQGFIAALLSHPKSIHEILQPIFYNQEAAFSNQFSGMTESNFSYQNFEYTRMKLITIIHDLLTSQDREFLVSFKSGDPMWQLSDTERLAELPAIKWKLLNIHKLKSSNPTKHILLLDKLKSCLKF